MNQEEGFRQRWELRRSKVDEDTSSDDEGSNSRGKHKIITDLVLFGNDEADDDDPRIHSHGDEKLHIHSGIDQTVKDDGKKLKSSKKSEGRAVKDMIRKRKTVHNSLNEKAMLKDLKIFAESLVRELSAAQDSMFARMRDEMIKLVASKSVKKNVRRSQKNASMQRKVAFETRPTISNRANEQHKGEKVRLPTLVNMNSFPCDQLLSSSYVALPKAIPTSHLRNQRNSMHLMNDHIPCMDDHSGSRAEFCKLLAAKSVPLRLQPQPQFGGFSLNYHKNWSLYGESRVGLPIPLHQGMDSGPNRSSPSHMANKGGVGVARFPTMSRALSERVIHNSVTSSVPRMSEGGIVAERSQCHRDVRFFLSDI